jgi:Ca-activated chloride channel family protein
MSFVHPHFAEPRWLWLAVLGPVLLAALQLYSASARSKQLSRLAAPQFVLAFTRSHSPVRRLAKSLMLVLAIAGMGLTLARPQWGERQETGQAVGHDVVFLLDCSRSMLASDVAPTRLDRAKLAIRDFLHRPGLGRVGLVAFAGQAFLQCPLTFDYSAFEDALQVVDEKTIPVLGTDIGIALQEGAHALDNRSTRKVLVLVTDGEDLEKQGLRTAQKLGTNGITIFTVGVGTTSGAEIHMLDEHGKSELVRDSKGEVVRTHMSPSTLQDIAQVTGGSYFPLGPLGEGLARVHLAMEALGEKPGAAPARRFGVDRFQIPLAVVLGLLVIESLIGTRRHLREIVPKVSVA